VLFIAWGALQAVAGFMSFTGRITGYMIGVSLAGVAMVLWFFMIFSAPFAALVGVGLNMFVMYALTAGANPDDYY
jgi:hypothetical protein